MKKKNVAAILAIFLGGFGVHQFYLERPGKGIAHAIFCWFPISWIIAWITALIILSMGEEEFDMKYNKQYRDRGFDFEKPDFERKFERKVTRKSRRRDRQDDFEQELEKRWKYPEQNKRKPKAPPARVRKKPNPYKQSGIKKFKEYDYDGAIEEFGKALEIDATDIATHFNLACAYSLNENAEKAFHHLDKAVANGFKDFPRIKEHDALAYLRIQDEFDEFVENKYRLLAQAIKTPQIEIPKEDLLSTQPDLLDQLKKLGELKAKGLLTEAEFANQKRKLLG